MTYWSYGAKKVYRPKDSHFDVPSMIRPGSRERQRVGMRPLAHARGYRKSKTHINRPKDSAFDVPGMIRPGSRER